MTVPTKVEPLVVRKILDHGNGWKYVWFYCGCCVIDYGKRVTTVNQCSRHKRIHKIERA